MESTDDVCSTSSSLPSTSTNELPKFDIKNIKSTIEDDNSINNLQTWSMCPMGKSRATTIVLFVCIYSFLFLFFASRSTIVLIAMTGLIAVWIVFLYLTGMLCVLYMMLKKYPPIEFNDELNGIPFSKMDSRVSFESTIPNIPQIMEVKC